MKKGKKATFGPTGPWFRMPRELTLSSALNPYQYRVLSILVERDDMHQSTKEKDRFWCYNDWLVSHSGMGRTKVKQTLKELDAMGFITITRGKTKRQANIFRINWDFINAYQGPKTMYDDIEEEEPSEEPQQSGSPGVPEPSKTYSSAMEWYQSAGEAVLVERYYPDFVSKMRSKDRDALDMAFDDMVSWIQTELPGYNVDEVLEQYVRPGYEKYKEAMGRS